MRVRPVVVALATQLLLASLSLAFAATATTPAVGQMNAHFINVGQGAAVLLEFACGAALIDTGGEKNDSFDSTEALTEYLDAFFRRRSDLNETLALVILSHAHIDHTRGLPTVLSRYTVRTVVDNGLETGSGGRQQKAAHTKVRESRGAIKHVAVTQRRSENRPGPPAGTLRCSQTAPEFKFLWGALDARDGWSKEILKNGNNSSVVTHLTFGRSTFLFPGDLEEDVHSDLISQVCPNGPTQNCLLDVDVYHVSHHGSHNGTTDEIVEAMTPRAAVISMGPFDRQETFSAFQHGHPRVAVVRRLLDHVSDILSPAAVELVATRGASAKVTAKSGPQFVKMNINRRIFGTGWPDGENIVITADSTGNLNVLSRVTPQ